MMKLLSSSPNSKMEKQGNTPPPFISICIASYNYGKYLERGFNAILRQKYHDYEIIYLDDASTDDSVSQIQKFIRKNPDIRITLRIHSENKGLLHTKSELLHLASGCYVMLCDADDWMGDQCLEILASRALYSNADRIISQVYDINAEGKIIQLQDFPPQPSKWLWNIHHGCLYKREIIEKYNLQILLYPDDVYLTTLFNLYSTSSEWIKKPLYYWFVHSDSVGRSQKCCTRTVIKRFYNILAFLKDISQKVSSSKDKSEIEFLLIKMYYLQLFHELKSFSIKDKLKAYYKIKKIMKALYPSYLHNCYLELGANQQPARSYAMTVIRLGYLLEKAHIMWIALIGYHFMCYWLEFDQ